MYGNLLTEKTDDLLGVPYNISFVEYESANEEEHGHPDLLKVVMYLGVCTRKMKAIGGNMQKDNEDHGKSPQGINIFNALGWLPTRCNLIT